MAGKVNIERYIKSLEEEYIPLAINAVAGEYFNFANFVIGKAVEPGMCPRKSGDLAESWIVQDPVIDGVKVSIVFGFNTNYAAAVHERLDVHHPNGQAKFLEKPLTEYTPQLFPRVIAAIEKAVSK